MRVAAEAVAWASGPATLGPGLCLLLRQRTKVHVGLTCPMPDADSPGNVSGEAQ